MSDCNATLIEDFRAHGGRVSSGIYTTRPLLLLTTTGAKTGRNHTTPLAYTRDRGRYVVVASKGGAPTHPQWYRNLRAHPVATAEVGTERFPVKAAFAEGDERRRLYDAHAAVHPVFRDYERKTARIIPVVLLERLPA